MASKPKILVLYAHPSPNKSRINEVILQRVTDLEHVTVNSLYECYPDFQIDVEREQQLLLTHDVIIFQHPMYWYSSPALLKEWQDSVLLEGFAYGYKGSALAGKVLQSVISTGGTAGAYNTEGHNRYTVHDFLRPFQQTAILCQMQWRPPLLIQGVFGVTKQLLDEHAQRYRDLLDDYTVDTSTGDK